MSEISKLIDSTIKDIYPSMWAERYIGGLYRNRIMRLWCDYMDAKRAGDTERAAQLAKEVTAANAEGEKAVEDWTARLEKLPLAELMKLTPQEEEPDEE